MHIHFIIAEQFYIGVRHLYDLRSSFLPLTSCYPLVKVLVGCAFVKKGFNAGRLNSRLRSMNRLLTWGSMRPLTNLGCPGARICSLNSSLPTSVVRLVAVDGGGLFPSAKKWKLKTKCQWMNGWMNIFTIEWIN